MGSLFLSEKGKEAWNPSMLNVGERKVKLFGD